jgi:hypothetical protein
MKTPRWLLPFTCGVDMNAIGYVVSLAESRGATLVPVSLVSAPDAPRSRGARLEDIQQSKDFLEAIQHKAVRYQVPVERYEVFTDDVIRSITVLIHDLHCDSIVLVALEKKDVLLRAPELKRLFMEPPTSLVLIRLPAHTDRTQIPHLGPWFLSWLRRLWRQQDDISQVQDAPEVEGPSWIKTEEHHRG